MNVTQYTPDVLPEITICCRICVSQNKSGECLMLSVGWSFYDCVLAHTKFPPSINSTKRLCVFLNLAHCFDPCFLCC